MESDFSKQLLGVIHAAIARHGSISELARQIGTNKAKISKWVKGQAAPGSADVAPIIDMMGARLVMPNEKMIDYDLLPKVAARPGAGASLETSGEREGLYAFRKDFMGAEHISAEHSVLMDVVGDSMEPLFSEGDTLLVDTSDTDVMDGRIYVVTLGDELRVKRVHKGLSGLILRSENQKYPDIHVEAADLDSFLVHGRVRWCGKVF